MLLLSLLFACAEDTAINYSTEACQNWDLDSEDPPLLSAESTGDGLLVTRNGLREDCSATFQPDVQIDRKVIRVFEAWEGAGDGTCNLCAMAALDISPLPGRSYEIQWYTEDDDVVPVDTVVVDIQ